VYNRQLGNFDTWFQSVSWNGRDSSGEPLPEGRYSVFIEAQAAQGLLPASPETLSLTLETEIDYSINIFPLSLTGGIPGLAFAPMPNVLPSGSFQIEGNILFGSFRPPSDSIREQAERPFSSLPFEFGLRTSPVNRLEISSVFNINPYFSNPAGWGITGSVKYNIISALPINLAAGIFYSWAGENGESPLSSGRGIGFFIPFSLDLLQLTSQSALSVSFTPGLFWRGPSTLTPLLLLCAGIFYRNGFLNAGLSVRPEIDFTNSDERLKLLAGAEVRFYPPPSNLYFLIQGGMWTHGGHTGGYGGAGIGIIY
jgi:hypothetical protein